MLIKGFLIVVILLTFTSCVSDRLTLATDNYEPDYNPLLRFDGYYTRKENSIDVYATKHWAQPITPKFFFANGSVAFLPTHENDQQLSETLTKYGDKKIGNWGVYQIKGDTLITEVLQPNSEKMKKERFFNYFIIKENTLLLFQWVDRNGNATARADTLYFRPFALKPDIDKGYIKTKSSTQHR
jgi:hypothetical protein